MGSEGRSVENCKSFEFFSYSIILLSVTCQSLSRITLHEATVMNKAWGNTVF